MEEDNLLQTLTHVFGEENVIVVDGTSSVSALDQLNSFFEKHKKEEEDEKTP